MRKLIILVFVFAGFLAKSQEAELDNIYLRQSIVLQDSSATNITTGDTLATIEKVRTTINDSIGSLVSSQWVDSTSGIVYTGGNVGIGTADPLSTLHLNKGNTLAYGLTYGDGEDGLYQPSDNILYMSLNNIAKWQFTESFLGSASVGGRLRFNGVTATSTGLIPDGVDPNTGIGHGVDDEGTLIAGSKQIASFKENVTEQFIINPQADLTGTAAAPSLAFGDADDGLYQPVDNQINITLDGAATWAFKTTLMGSTNSARAAFLEETPTATNPNIIAAQSDPGTGIGWPSSGAISLVANSVEGLRINDAEAHSVAGIANYETLVTNDDDITNKKYVDDNDSSFLISGEIHASATTQNTVFDLLKLAIPSIDDEVIVNGAISFTDSAKDYMLVISKAVRSTSTLIILYGIRYNLTNNAAIFVTYNLTDASATALDASMVW